MEARVGLPSGSFFGDLSRRNKRSLSLGTGRGASPGEGSLEQALGDMPLLRLFSCPSAPLPTYRGDEGWGEKLFGITYIVS